MRTQRQSASWSTVLLPAAREQVCGEADTAHTAPSPAVDTSHVPVVTPASSTAGKAKVSSRASRTDMLVTDACDEEERAHETSRLLVSSAEEAAGGTLGASDWPHTAVRATEESRDGSLHAIEYVPPVFHCPSIPTMVIVLLMFASLSQSFSSTCVVLFMNMDLTYGPIELTRYYMYVGYTSWLQPLIGAVADTFVVFGEKRRPLFIVSALGNAIIYSVFCFQPQATTGYVTFVLVSMLSNAFTMSIYIPLNGILVEVGRADGEARDKSIARVSAIMAKSMVYRSIGSLAGTIIHTVLVVKLSVRSMLGVSALIFAILIPLVLATPRVLFLRTAANVDNLYKRVHEACAMARNGFNIHDWRSDGVCFVTVLAFVFGYCVMPDAQTVYFNYLYAVFSFEPWFYSMDACIGYVGSIAGAYIFSRWMDFRAQKEFKGGIRTSSLFIFVVGCLVWAASYVSNLLLCTGIVTDVLHIPVELYVLFDNFISMAFVRFAYMPTVIMAAEHAPKHFEATAFEVFSVASMGGGVISSLLTSLIAKGLGMTREDYSRLRTLLCVSIACKLAPMPMAYFLPERRRPGPDAEDGGIGEAGSAEPRVSAVSSSSVTNERENLH